MISIGLKYTFAIELKNWYMFLEEGDDAFVFANGVLVMLLEKLLMFFILVTFLLCFPKTYFEWNMMKTQFDSFSLSFTLILYCCNWIGCMLVATKCARDEMFMRCFPGTGDTVAIIIYQSNTNPN